MKVNFVLDFALIVKNTTQPAQCHYALNFSHWRHRSSVLSLFTDINMQTSVSTSPIAYFRKLLQLTGRRLRLNLRVFDVKLVDNGWNLSITVHKLPFQIEVSRKKPKQYLSHSTNFYYSYSYYQDQLPFNNNGGIDPRFDKLCALICRTMARLDTHDLQDFVDFVRQTPSSPCNITNKKYLSIHYKTIEKLQNEIRPIIHLELYGPCDQFCLFCADNYRLLESPDLQKKWLRAKRYRWREYTYEKKETEIQLISSRLHTIFSINPNAVLVFSGDDCLKSPAFRDLLEIAANIGFKDMKLLCPGYQLIDDDLLQFVLSCGIEDIILTMHAYSEALFDQLVGVKDRGRLMWQLLEKLSKSDAKVKINVPLIKQNLNEIPLLIHQLVRDFNFDIVCFYWYPDADYQEAFEHLAPPYEEVIQIFMSLLRNYDIYSITIKKIPPCVLLFQMLKNFFISYNKSYVVSNLECYQYVEQCQYCYHQKDCPGIYKKYLDFYPHTKIQALKARKYAFLSDAE